LLVFLLIASIFSIVGRSLSLLGGIYIAFSGFPLPPPTPPTLGGGTADRLVLLSFLLCEDEELRRDREFWSLSSIVITELELNSNNQLVSRKWCNIINLEFRRRSSLRRGEFDLDRDLDLDLRFLAFLASFFSFLAFLSALRRFFSNNSLICKSRIFLSFRIFKKKNSKKNRYKPIVETLSSVEGRLGIYSGRSLIFGICGVISLNTEGFLEKR